MFPALAEAVYESFYKAENEIFHVVNYSTKAEENEARRRG